MKGREFKRVWGYPWDYGYLLKLEQYKIREMCKYFKKSKLVVGWELQVRDLTICDKLIDIILEEDKQYQSWLHSNYNISAKDRWQNKGLKFPIYVNVRNYKRFLPQARYDATDMLPFLIENFKISLRQQKALYLYNKIRAYRMQRWWD